MDSALPHCGQTTNTVWLASASPRRHELLALMGIPFRTAPTYLEERFLDGESPATAVSRLAQEKARAVPCPSGALVLAADTVVVLDGLIMGKPASAEQARQMLRDLRNRRHLVMTGIALVRNGDTAVYTETATTSVWMRDYSEAEIEDYIQSGDVWDKAGSYAIQSVAFAPVARLSGCYPNVVGLPLCAVRRGIEALAPEFMFPGRNQAELRVLCQRCRPTCALLA